MYQPSVIYPELGPRLGLPLQQHYLDPLLPAVSCTESWVSGKETPWTSQTGAWLTMLLAKTFTMPVSPAKTFTAYYCGDI